MYIDFVYDFLIFWDLCSGLIKLVFFGVLIVVIGINWGLIIIGGVKGVGEFIIIVVVIFLIFIFIFNFFLFWVMF